MAQIVEMRNISGSRSASGPSLLGRRGVLPMPGHGARSPKCTHLLEYFPSKQIQNLSIRNLSKMYNNLATFGGNIIVD